MKIYLAADYDRKHEMRGCRDVIEALGHKVTSTWLDIPDTIEGMGIGGQLIDLTNVGQGAAYARVDHWDLYNCDTFILFTTGKLSRGGRHTELGMALARGKDIIIVGPRENVFQCHPDIAQYSTWRAFVIEFSELSGVSVDVVDEIHYRDDIHETGAACGTATPNDEWTADPELVSCLACELRVQSEG